MDITIRHGAIQNTTADALIVAIFEGVPELVGAAAAVNQALGGAIAELITSGDLKGKSGEVGVLYPRGAIPAKRVIVAGLGKPEEFTLDKLRKAAGAGSRKAHALGAKSIATSVHNDDPGQVEQASQATVEGALLGLYEFRLHKTEAAEQAPVESFSLVEPDASRVPAVTSGARLGQVLAEATNLARDLVNQPSNYMTPSLLAEAARQAAEASGLDCQVYGPDWMREQKMGALLGVTQGSDEPARFIVLEHGRGRSEKPLVFVGKGITFDSGGISIKPAEHMEAMKSDMGGAAAVIGALHAIAQLELPLHVIGLAPACENLPSGRAYKPGDVVRARNGKSVEVINTDAEGRMILADALCYAAEYQPAAVVDIATLTGACVIALGQNKAAGMFASSEDLSEQLRQAGAAAGERLWPMPLFPDYRDSLKSEVADLKNTGSRYGGVGASAIFLKEFTDYTWAHLDIAGMVLLEDKQTGSPQGATGFGVRTLVEFARQFRPAPPTP
ncbi:MAG: leucyl aminopeptidase [Thermoflexales bacterium]|nr:leucyl aminopeptidase [Thermoflexales bacterium]